MSTDAMESPYTFNIRRHGKGIIPTRNLIANSKVCLTFQIYPHLYLLMRKTPLIAYKVVIE